MMQHQTTTNVVPSFSLLSALDVLAKRARSGGLRRRSLERIPLEFTPILEIGCGEGDDLLEFAEARGANIEVVGIDPCGELISEAQRRARHVALNVRFVMGEARDLPFDSGYFDAICVDGSFAARVDADAVLKQLLRVVRPGGLLLIHRDDAPEVADA